MLLNRKPQMLESRGKHNSWGIWARLRLEYMVPNLSKTENGLHAKNGFPETYKVVKNEFICLFFGRIWGYQKALSKLSDLYILSANIWVNFCQSTVNDISFGQFKFITRVTTKWV